MARTTQINRLAAVLALSPKHRTRPKQRTPMQPTLGHMDQPVSAADIALWCATIAPHVSPARWTQYASAYNVPDKIRRAKDAGQWPPAPPAVRYG